jgi:amidase
MDDPVLTLGAAALAAAIRRGDYTAAEVVGRHLDHIDRHNGALNAIVTLDADGAREAARRADAAQQAGEPCGPLHGVPITIKDAFQTAGCRTTCGAAGLKDFVPRRDATVVARLRAAGAIVLGKTNVPELTSDYQTWNRVFGRTNNPWDHDRSPGGSTGGGAAAVAAGLSPLDVGSDLGGSIRIPAHYCGIHALKPTVGLVPITGHIPPWPGRPRGLRHLGTVGFSTRALEDLRLVLALTAGADNLDACVVPVPLGAPPRPIDLRGLRVAWTDSFPGASCTAEVSEGIAAFVDDLARAGCVTKAAYPADLDVPRACEIYGTIMGAETASAYTHRRPMTSPESRGPGAPPAADADSFTRGYLAGRNASSRVYLAALRERCRLVMLLEQFLSDWDVWICPVAPTTAIAHAEGRPMLQVDGTLVPYLAQGWFCVPLSLTHHPVVVMPLALTRDGLPYGIQLVSRLWRDGELLATAVALASQVAPLPHPLARLSTIDGTHLSSDASPRRAAAGEEAPCGI